MSYNRDTKTISSGNGNGVSVYDVQQALVEYDTNDVATLCESRKVNIWAKHKPLPVNALDTATGELTKTVTMRTVVKEGDNYVARDKTYSVFPKIEDALARRLNYGVIPYPLDSSDDYSDGEPVFIRDLPRDTKAASGVARLEWPASNSQTQKCWHNLADFDGYKHDATLYRNKYKNAGGTVLHEMKPVWESGHTLTVVNGSKGVWTGVVPDDKDLLEYWRTAALEVQNNEGALATIAHPELLTEDKNNDTGLSVLGIIGSQIDLSLVIDENCFSGWTRSLDLYMWGTWNGVEGWHWVVKATTVVGHDAQTQPLAAIDFNDDTELGASYPNNQNYGLCVNLPLIKNHARFSSRTSFKLKELPQLFDTGDGATQETYLAVDSFNTVRTSGGASRVVVIPSFIGRIYVDRSVEMSVEVATFLGTNFKVETMEMQTGQLFLAFRLGSVTNAQSATIQGWQMADNATIGIYKDEYGQEPYDNANFPAFRMSGEDLGALMGDTNQVWPSDAGDDAPFVAYDTNSGNNYYTAYWPTEQTITGTVYAVVKVRMKSESALAQLGVTTGNGNVAASEIAGKTGWASEEFAF